MISYLQHSEIDKQRWDESISRSHNRLPNALSGYLDIVSPGWDALIGEDYTELMPLPHRSKFGISYVYQPLLCQQLGVFSTLRQERFCVDTFLQAIPDKFKLVDISLNTKNYVKEVKGISQFVSRLNHELNLDRPYQDIRAGYSKSHLKNIRHFQESCFEVLHSNISALDFCRLKMESLQGKELTLSRRERKTYFRLLHELDQRNQLDIYVAMDEKQQVSGGICFILLDFNRIIFQSFCQKDGRKNGLIFYLMDQFIEKNAGRNLSIDFMGSSITGIRYRNLGFGCHETQYTYLRRNTLSRVLQRLKK